MLAMVRFRVIAVMTGTIWNLLDDGFEPGRLFDFGYWFGFVIPALRVVLLGFLALDLDMDCLGW